jgi:plastocyanin
MAEKVVTAKIDAKGKTVTFGGGPGLPFPKTFQVEVGDTIKWVLEGLPAESTARVRFAKFPNTPGTPLLVHGDTVEGNGGVINGGQIAADAFDGEYSYEIELLTAQGPTKLRCVWSDGVVPRDAPMAGGQKSGGPR